MSDRITLSHGDGGTKTNELIENVFLKNYGEDIRNTINDSFVFHTDNRRLAFTTDSFIVKPLFFRGGDIGKLAICGTINDLAAAGAVPLYISVGFIIEEGLDIDTLYRISKSMGEVCDEAGVKIVTGDTKVTEKGCTDGVYINTSGIGAVSEHYNTDIISPGDEIIITGSIAEHGTAILLDRYDLEIETDIISDCNPLNNLITGLDEELKSVKLMKDPTRGGLATVLNEISKSSRLSISLDEILLPVKKQVRAVNEILGTDPLYLACEGRMVMVVRKGYGERVLRKMMKIKNCAEAQIIGRFTKDTLGLVYMNTTIGGKRIVSSSEGQTVPRIC